MRAALYGPDGKPVGIADASLEIVQINAFAIGGVWRDISGRDDIRRYEDIPPLDQLPPPTPPE